MIKNPDRYLWLCVIRLAILDFHAEKSADNHEIKVPGKPEMTWSEYFRSFDFQMVCEFAGVNPKEVMRANRIYF